MELTVIPMVVQVDNRGAVDLVNSWTATGRTPHDQLSAGTQGAGTDFSAVDFQRRHVIGQIHEERGRPRFLPTLRVFVRENPPIECVEPATSCVPVGEGVGDRVYPRDVGTGQMQGTGPLAAEHSTGVNGGVNGDVTDEVDTGEEHVATVVAAREEG
jgi:hypothetical protein